MIDQKQDVSLGIFLLPSDQDAESLTRYKGEIQKSFPEAEKFKNVPHVSLFQMQTPFAHLREIEEKVRERSTDYPSFDLESPSLDHRYGNICLSFSPDQKGVFRSMVSTVIESTQSYRSKDLLPQIKGENLDPPQRDLVEKYGIYWNVPPEKSIPHLTLFYNVQDAQIPSSGLTRLHLDKIALGYIGFYGNVEQIIQEFSLCR